MNNKKIFPMVLILGLISFYSLFSKPYELYEQMLGDIKNLSIDESKTYKVKDFALIRDVASINIDSGYFYFCKPVNNRVIAAIFKGKGIFNFKPPTLVETNQLKRLLNKDFISSEIKSMLIIFGDSTAYDIEQQGTKENNQGQGLKGVISDFLEYELDLKKNNIDQTIAQTILDDRHNDMFYAFFTLEGSEDLFFKIDPYSVEEIQLYRGDWYAGMGKYNELVNQFHYMETYEKDSKISLNHSTDELEVTKYTINSTIKSSSNILKGQDFIADASLDIKILSDKINWVPFELLGKLDVSSVKLKTGEILHYYKSDQSGTLWIKLPKQYSINDSLTINLSYKGPIFDRVGNYTLLSTSIGWYPRYGYREHAFFDLTFTTPDNYKFVSIGDLIDKKKVEDTYVSHWITPYKIRNASFNIGAYSSKDSKAEGFQDITVFYVDSDHRDDVLKDAALSVEFYSKIFGPIPPKKLTITELPAFHGEAFPGLIHLSHVAFQNMGGTTEEGSMEQFCAHEVAHQWWGINVDFQSYHDQWLSEGFAEYSSLLYTQLILKDNKKFFRFMQNYKKALISARKTFISKGVTPGPISLGYRNNSSKTEGDYDLVIYKKGAWVFHMLRNMFIDLKTMKEDVFLGILKEFYQENQGKMVSTKDFQKKIEQKTGFDFTWFFDQWVDDYKIPTYKFAYKTEKTPEGKYKVKCRVEQLDVPPTFQMIVPIKIDFGDKGLTRLQTMITGAKFEFDLPLLPEEPKEVIFNDLESVLCDVENVSW